MEAQKNWQPWEYTNAASLIHFPQRCNPFLKKLRKYLSRSYLISEIYATSALDAWKKTHSQTADKMHSDWGQSSYLHSRTKTERGDAFWSRWKHFPHWQCGRVRPHYGNLALPFEWFLNLPPAWRISAFLKGQKPSSQRKAPCILMQSQTGLQVMNRRLASCHASKMGILLQRSTEQLKQSHTVSFPIQDHSPLSHCHIPSHMITKQRRPNRGQLSSGELHANSSFPHLEDKFRLMLPHTFIPLIFTIFKKFLVDSWQKAVWSFNILVQNHKIFYNQN